MIPVEPTAEHATYWADREGGAVEGVVIGGPEEGPDVYPCPALVGTVFHTTTDGGMQSYPVVHVAFQLDEIEVAHLAHGGTLWLTTFVGLPIHRMEVVPPPTASGEGEGRSDG